jgi:SAM-dependent methyltransferase
MKRQCPVCANRLADTGERYSIEELLALWTPLRFSDRTLEAHRRQASATTLFRCNRCGLEIFLPQMIGTADFYTEAYGLQGEATQGSLPYSTCKWDFVEAGKDLTDVSRLLEIGSGPGHFLDAVASRLEALEGIESNPVARETCRRKGYKVHGDLVECCPSRPFDAAMAFHVLEHVKDPLEFLRAVASKVRPGGIIALSLPNRAGPIRFIRPCAHDMPPHHATRWRPKTLRALADKLGWEIDRLVLQPLVREDWYYYSVYVPRRLIGGTSRVAFLARRLFERAIEYGLFVLDRLGMARRLRGPAMYVCYRLPTTVRVGGQEGPAAACAE